MSFVASQQYLGGWQTEYRWLSLSSLQRASKHWEFYQSWTAA